ncbi:hypothetical protein OESDEN_05949 [Oesophagostomum dentatum]|uniref:Uncharacterized protein n=1 Tax=Oesophagostomum dentatum TaxID=61180 RepID=A0A0B1TFJ4_OESDE|nr:hypothetical protein OESDEN_05949 [Oesophagostomum dentatum]
MDAKLGYSTYKSRSESANSEVHDLEDEESEQNTVPDDSEPSNSRSAVSNSIRTEKNTAEQGHYRSIKPAQANPPKFHGNAEDFPEFWAIFETLVHKGTELDDVVKAVLVSGQMLDNQTVEHLLAQLKKEITAKSFVENRLDHAIGTKKRSISINDHMQTNGAYFAKRAIIHRPHAEQ